MTRIGIIIAKLKATVRRLLFPACKGCGHLIGSNDACAECQGFNVDMNTW